MRLMSLFVIAGLVLANPAAAQSAQDSATSSVGIRWSSDYGFETRVERTILLGHSTLVTPSIRRQIAGPLAQPNPLLGLSVERPLTSSLLLTGVWDDGGLDPDRYHAEISWARVVGLGIRGRGDRQQGILRLGFVNVVLNGDDR